MAEQRQRDYSAAVSALNTLQTNFSVIDAIRKSGRAKNKNAIPEMQEWCRRIGYEPSAFDKLNAIHIAGTKGKGSTSAFISSILCQYTAIQKNGTMTPDDQRKPFKKIGLYTSPHLRSVRERIQINGEPLPEPLFARYFFEVWDRLEAAEARHGPPAFEQAHPTTTEANAPPAIKPVYFRYLTLVALHAYMSEGVDTAVIECGIGGEFDSTNIFERPTVTAVTSLGIDHTSMLGDTLAEIAWHKAGIFKAATTTGAAYTVDAQDADAMAVLERRADEAGVRLTRVARHRDIESGAVKLGLAADFQKTNASLAVAVAAAFLRQAGVAKVPQPGAPEARLPAHFVQGLEETRWGGRCETRRQGDVMWHLDGGHTLESIRLAADWFASCIVASGKRQKRILLFNQQTRDAAALARELHSTLSTALTAQGVATEMPLFSNAVFSTNVTFDAEPMPGVTGDDGAAKAAAGGRYKPDLMSMNTSAVDVSKLTVQKALAEMWVSVDKGSGMRVSATIEQAVRYIREVDMLRNERKEEEGEETVVLVTGSLHLVGGVLEVLDTI